MGDPAMAKIRANSVLPARREALRLTTTDGLTLVGELALPDGTDPVATIVCVHPLPTHGGMMDSHVFRKAAARLPALANLAVLRFNTRGTSSVQGTSEGAFDNAGGELLDVAAALELAELRALPHIWLVGWSFGADLTLLAGGDDARVEGAVLLSPPLRFPTDEQLRSWDTSAKPLTALIPECDDYLRPDEARRRFALIRRAEVVSIKDGKHLWVGNAERALDEIVARVAPSVQTPLPSEWAGPMDRGDSSMYADRTLASFADVPLPGPFRAARPEHPGRPDPAT
jgi:alpha/beta superfamily hydrolase